MEETEPKESLKCVTLNVMRTEFELYHIISCWRAAAMPTYPELFIKHSTFSAYEFCFNPDRQEFCERTSLSDKESHLADIHEKDIVNPEERPKQQAKAEAEAEGSDSSDLHNETVTGSVGGFDSH